MAQSPLAISNCGHRSSNTAVATLLTLCFTLSYLDRQILSLLVQPIQASLRLSDTQLGLMQGVSFSLFYVAASLPLAWLSDRHNRARIIAACVAFWSVMTMACGLAGNFWQLLAARIGVAIGEAGLPPAALALMADRFDRKRLALATSVFMIAPFVGGGLALFGGGALYSASAGWTMPHVPGIGTLERWQLLFIIVGAPGLLAALALLLVQDPRHRGVASITPLTEAADATENSSFKTLSHFILRQWRFTGVYMLAIALTSLMLNAYIAWLPAAIMRAHDIDAGTMGMLFGPIYLITGVAGTLLAGLVISRRGGNNPVSMTLGMMRAGALCLLPAAIFGPLTGILPLKLLLMGGATFLVSAIIGMSSLPLQYLAPQNIRSQSIAFLGLVSALLGTGAGPLVTGILSDAMPNAAHSLSFALSLVGAIAVPAIALLFHVAGKYPLTLASAPTTTTATT